MMAVMSDDDTAIEQRLIEAQQRYEAARTARAERKAAVMAARAAGWPKYRIATALGVRPPTVDSIIASAEKENPA